MTPPAAMASFLPLLHVTSKSAFTCIDVESVYMCMVRISKALAKKQSAHSSVCVNKHAHERFRLPLPAGVDIFHIATACRGIAFMLRSHMCSSFEDSTQFDKEMKASMKAHSGPCKSITKKTNINREKKKGGRLETSGQHHSAEGMMSSQKELGNTVLSVDATFAKHILRKRRRRRMKGQGSYTQSGSSCKDSAGASRSKPATTFTTAVDLLSASSNGAGAVFEFNPIHAVAPSTWRTPTHIASPSVDAEEVGPCNQLHPGCISLQGMAKYVVFCDTVLARTS
jgi:hypothetical protein